MGAQLALASPAHANVAEINEALPVTYALIVAASEFTDPDLAPYSLHGAALDADNMASALSLIGGAETELTTLKGTQATLNAVELEFERLITSAQAGDRVILYFSAHGSRIPDVGELDEADRHDEVLLMADAANWQNDSLPGALLDDDLNAVVRQLRANGADVFLVIDSCASGGASRSGEGDRVRNLPPSLLSVPEMRMRAVERRDLNWVEDDMPAGSGRLVTFAAGPTYQAAWDTPEGGIFTQTLAEALASAPADFVTLAEEQIRRQALSALPTPRSEISGDIEAGFFFANSQPALLANSLGLPRPEWDLTLHASSLQNCELEIAGSLRELNPEERQTLDHCDAVMLSISSKAPGYFDAWYIDSASQRTLLSPVGGQYVNGRTPAHLSFVYIAQDMETGAPLPTGTDRLLLMRRDQAGAHDAAVTIEFAVGE